MFDLSGRPIEVDISPPEALPSAYEILYWGHRLSNAVARQEGTELDQYIADGDHALFLVATPGAKALLQHRNGVHTVCWCTRCVESIPLSEQARQGLEYLLDGGDSESSDQDSDEDHIHSQVLQSSSGSSLPSSPTPGARQRPQRQAATQNQHVIRASPSQASSSPRVSSDVTFLPTEQSEDVAEDSSESDSDETESGDEALSSEAWRGEEGQSPENLRHLRQRLQSRRACQCAGIRYITITCPTLAEAQNIHRALRRHHLAGEVDPEEILPGDPHTMTVRQYVAARHVHNIPTRGLFDTNARMKMMGFPLEVQHDDNRNAAPAPMHA